MFRGNIPVYFTFSRISKVVLSGLYLHESLTQNKAILFTKKVQAFRKQPDLFKIHNLIYLVSSSILKMHKSTKFTGMNKVQNLVNVTLPV